MNGQDGLVREYKHRFTKYVLAISSPDHTMKEPGVETQGSSLMVSKRKLILILRQKKVTVFRHTCAALMIGCAKRNDRHAIDT